MRTADEELRLFQVAERAAKDGNAALQGAIERLEAVNLKLHHCTLERIKLVDEYSKLETAIIDEAAELEATNAL